MRTIHLLIPLLFFLISACDNSKDSANQPPKDNAGGGKPGLNAMSFSQAKDKLKSLPPAIQASIEQTPAEYSFFNQAGDSSVAYLGQVHRLVLIEDAKAQFGAMKRGQFSGDISQANAKINRFYNYNKQVDGAETFGVQANQPAGGFFSIYEGDVYQDIFSGEINLKSKMAGIDNPSRDQVLVGWTGSTFLGLPLDQDSNQQISPDEFFSTIVKTLANNATNGANFNVSNGMGGTQEIEGAFITPEGLDLAQLGQKFLLSAVAFSQATGDYFSVDLDPADEKGLLADNTQLYVGKDNYIRPYTVLQHHWDEAFGYFGAARNYLDYTDEQIKQKVSIDKYQSYQVYKDPADTDFLMVGQTYDQPDGFISLNSEKNMGFSINPAKRDLGAFSQDTDFTKTIMEAFLKGRQLLQDQPEGYLEYAQAYAVVAIAEWEKVIAATLVHYINATIADLDKFGTTDYDFTQLAKHFSEMKGFAFAFQFNRNSLMTPEDFKTMHQKMGNTPVLPDSPGVTPYKDRLLEARALLAKSFGFNQENTENW